jgi:hypothetical protein
MSARRLNGELAFRIAEAGLHQAAMRLKEDSTYTGEQNTNFGSGKVTIALSAVPGNPNQKAISSVATVSYGEGLSISRTLHSMVDLGTGPAIGNYSVITKGPLSFKGNASIGSFPQTGIGNVASNSTVSLQGSVNVDGNASAVGTVGVKGATSVSGSLNPNSQPVAFPSLDFNALKNVATTAKVTNGDVTVTGGATVTLTGLINGNLNLSGYGHVIIKSPVYVTGTVSFGGSGPVDGGLLISAGDISATGQNTLSGGGTLALATLGNFSLSGGASVSAAIYAPNGTVSMHGHSSVFGTIAANTLSIAGTPTITRNTNYKWPSEFLSIHLGYYQE